MQNERCDETENLIYETKESYVIFIDETGDPYVHFDVSKYEAPTVFPVMTVTALIMKTKDYENIFVPEVDAIKIKFWGSRDIKFHSNEIRRKDGIFKVLLDDAVYTDFKSMMLNVYEKCNVTIISSSINKLKLLQRAQEFKKMSGEDYNIGDLYLTNVDWVLERIGHFLKNDNTAKIIFEARGKKESRRIQSVLSEAKLRGTFYHSKERFKGIDETMLFFTKKDNVNGLQMVDYCTYPFARYAKDKTDDNKLFELLRKYIYKGDYGEYGLKEWP